jgi:hypothetical protein
MADRIKALDQSEPSIMETEDDFAEEGDRQPQHKHMHTRLYRKTGGVVLDDSEDEEEAAEESGDINRTESSCETPGDPDKVCASSMQLLMHGRR